MIFSGHVLAKSIGVLRVYQQAPVGVGMGIDVAGRHCEIGSVDHAASRDA